MGIGFRAAGATEFGERVLAASEVSQHQAEVVVGPLMLGRQCDGLTQVHFGFGPPVLQIEAIAHVAEDVGAAGLALQGLPIQLLRLLELARPIVQHCQAQAGIGAVRVAFEGLQVGGGRLGGIAAFFHHPAHGDLDVRRLPAGYLACCQGRARPKTVRTCWRVKVLAARQEGNP